MFAFRPQWLLEFGVCSSCMILLVWILTIVIGRWSAAIRHRVWFLTFCGLAILPIAILFLPVWEVPVLAPQFELVANSPTIVASTSEPSEQPSAVSTKFKPDAHSFPAATKPDSFADANEVESSGIHPSSGETGTQAIASEIQPFQSQIQKPFPVYKYFLAIWLIGFLVCLSRLAVSAFANHRLGVRGKEVKAQSWIRLHGEFTNVLMLKRPVRLLESDDAIVPMTWGVAKPIVALPTGSDDWPESRARAVLMHELAHIKRKDVLIQTISYLICAFYWFHPLVWLGLRKLRIERELACDDCVIATGQKPTDYAEQLVQIARTFKYKNNTLSVAMASTSKLEYRVTSLLDFARSHVPVSPNLSRVLVFGTLISILALSTIRLGHRTFVDNESITSLVSALGGMTDASSQQTHDVTGRVTTPDGKPKSGASVTLYSRAWMRPPHETVMESFKTTTSGQDGYFTISLSAEELQQLQSRVFDRDARDLYARSSSVIATMPGFGLAIASCPFQDSTHKCDGKDAKDCIFHKDLVLKLAVASTPIEGRIVDLEGRPVAGAIVRPQTISSVCDDVESWLAKANNNPIQIDKAKMKQMSDKGYGNVPDVVTFPVGNSSLRSRVALLEQRTDAEGRFAFTDLGDGRKVEFEVSGKGIATTVFSAVTHDFKSVPMPTERSEYEAQVVYGARPVVSVEPSQIIRGQVTDSETGKPIVDVQLSFSGLYAFSNGTSDGTKYCQTDEKGRYVFDGIGRPADTASPRSFKIEMAPDQPYFAQRQRVPVQKDVESIEIDVKLTPCKMISGRLVDQQTKQPIQGRVMYYPHLDNEKANKYPKFKRSSISVGFKDAARTNTNGSYSVKCIEGTGVLAAFADDGRRYKVAVGGTEAGVTLQGGFDDQIAYVFPGSKHFNSIMEVDTTKQSESIEIELVPRNSKNFRVETDSGAAVVDFSSTGRFPKQSVSGGAGFVSKETAKNQLEIFGMDEDESRELLIWNREKTHGTTTTISQETKSPILLQPTGVVRGKIKDFKEKFRNAFIKSVIVEKNPGQGWAPSSAEFSQVSTSDGAFELELLPGSHQLIRIVTGPQAKDIMLANPITPGEVIDLSVIDMETGDETFDNRDKTTVSTSPTNSNINGGNQAADKTATFAGTVVCLTDKKAVASADIAIIAARIDQSQGIWEDSDILATGKTDSEGKFELKLSGVTNKTHVNVNVIVRNDGSGISFQSINPEESISNLKLGLAPEKVIRGRIIDLEGESGGGVEMSVIGLIDPEARREMSVGGATREMRVNGVMYESDKPCTVWAPVVKSDSEGRFRIHGIPAGMGAFIKVKGNDRFAPQSISLGTGEPEERGERDMTYRSIVKNPKPNEEVLLTLEPARNFTGFVTFEDTGKPASNTKISILASQQDGPFGSLLSTEGMTNDKGEYNLMPESGIRFILIAFAPDGTAYLGRVLPPVVWKGGGTKKTLDATLRRGILITGVVINKKTGEPVAEAPIQYHPESANNLNATDDVINGWQAIQETDKDGRFKIAVLPGPGRLLVHGGQDSNFVLQQFGSREVYDGTTAGHRSYTHLVVKLNPKENSEAIELEPIELTPGNEVTGTVSDDDGNPVEEFLVYSTLKASAQSNSWNYLPSKSIGGKFELRGVDDRLHTIHLKDIENKIGASVKLKAGDRPNVTLKPFGSVKARLTNKKTGKPVSSHPITLNLVMIPSADSKGEEDSKYKLLDADTLLPEETQTSNEKGEIVYPDLIPGAKYQIIEYEDGRLVELKVFTAESSKTIDLGEVKVTARE